MEARKSKYIFLDIERLYFRYFQIMKFNIEIDSSSSYYSLHIERVKFDGTKNIR